MSKRQKIEAGIFAAILASVIAIMVVVVAIVVVVMATVGGSKNPYDRHMELAQRYLDDLQYEQAIAEYKAAIEIEPKNEEAYLALADIYVQQGDYEAALDILNQGLEQTESGELKMRAETVSRQYEAAQALQAEQVRKEEQLAREAEEERENEEKEREEAERAKEIAYSQHMEAAKQYIMEENYGQALKEYEAALELYPDRADVYLAMAELYVQMEDFETAWKVLKQGITKTNDERLENYLHEIRAGKTETLHTNDGKTIINYYGDNGNIETKIVYDANGMVSSIAEFNANGNMMKLTQYSDGEIELIREYYEGGKVAKKIQYLYGEIWLIQEYNEAGKVVKKIQYLYGEIRLIQEYNEGGRIVREIQYWHEDKLAEEPMYTIIDYDENGNEEKRADYYPDGTEWNH